MEAGKFNIAFEAAFATGQVDTCIDILVKDRKSVV